MILPPYQCDNSYAPAPPSKVMLDDEDSANDPDRLGSHADRDTGAGTGFSYSGYDVRSLRNGWHRLTVTACAATVTFYVDEVSVGSHGRVSQSDFYSVGNTRHGGQEWGYLHKFRIYDGIYTPEQLVTGHTSDPVCPGCVTAEVGSDPGNGWCRSDICGDSGGDCCAPGDEARSCTQSGYSVAAGGTSSYAPCLSNFGQGAIYQCCSPTSGKTLHKFSSIIDMMPS